MSSDAASWWSAHGWVRAAVWAVAAAVVSCLAGMLCITVGAMAAMALEVSATRAVGLAINWAAVIFMIASYSALLALVMRHLMRNYEVPGAVWFGLLAFPVAWGVLMLAYPEAGYEITPIWVNGTGLIVAWLAVGSRGRAMHPAPSSSAGG